MKFQCLDCNRGFFNFRSACEAVARGCPDCGSQDIDIALDPYPAIVESNGFLDEELNEEEPF